jgi:hypothetical protein
MDDFLAAALDNRDLYEITLSDAGPIVFKLLPVSAYQGVSRLIQEHPRTQPEVEEAVWKLCVVLDPYGDDLVFSPAGIITTVAQLILFLSFPKELEDITQGLAQARDIVQNSILLQIQAEICRVFPAYTPEALDQLEFPRLLQLMSQAEYLTKSPFQFESSQKTSKKFSAPTVPASIDFDSENRELSQEMKIIDPHELFGLRKG